MRQQSEEKFLLQLGERIRELRIEKGLTQEDFDDQTKLGITSRALQDIEYGKSNPRIYTLYKITARLGVDIRDLLP